MSSCFLSWNSGYLYSSGILPQKIPWTSVSQGWRLSSFFLQSLVWSQTLFDVDRISKVPKIFTMDSPLQKIAETSQGVFTEAQETVVGDDWAEVRFLHQIKMVIQHPRQNVWQNKFQPHGNKSIVHFVEKLSNIKNGKGWKRYPQVTFTITSMQLI